MPDAFFQKKRKRTTTTTGGGDGSRSTAGPSHRRSSSGPTKRTGANRSNVKDKNNRDDDEDDEAEPGNGIDDMQLEHDYDGMTANSQQEAESFETPAEARIRLAKIYLQGLKKQSTHGDSFFDQGEGQQEEELEQGADAAQADRDNISARLRNDVKEQSGKIHLFLSQRIAPVTRFLQVQGGHRLSVTAATVSTDAKWLFTAGKDGAIIRWRLKDGKKIKIIPKRDTATATTKQDGKQGRVTTTTTATTTTRSKTSGAARRRQRYSKPSQGGKSNDNDNDDNNNNMFVEVGQGEGHSNEIWTISVSSDGKYLASAGPEKFIGIWQLTTSSSQEPNEKWIKSLTGHKDSISSVTFRMGSNDLYSASFDRTIKLFDVSQLSYIETLFGHQEAILSLSCLRSETAVSAGGRDRTCRFWKISQESQLVFRAGTKSKLREVLEGGDLARIQEREDTIKLTNDSSPKQEDQEKKKEEKEEEGKMTQTYAKEMIEGSVDCVTMIDDYHFISGGDTGTLSLWNLTKKKPIFSISCAHGFQQIQSTTEGIIHTAKWITSLASLPFSDLFVSGSWDDQIRIWSIHSNLRCFNLVSSIPIFGIVNSLQLVLVPNDSINPFDWKRQQQLPPPSSSDHHSGDDDDGVGDGDDSSKPPPSPASTKNMIPIVIAAIGQEHKFGRWLKFPKAKNQAIVIPLSLLPTPPTSSSS